MELIDTPAGIDLRVRGQSSQLHIDKPDGDISVVSAEKAGSAGTAVAVEGLAGIIRLRLTQYVIVITRAHSVGKLLGHDVRQADQFRIVPLRDWKVKDETESHYLNLLDTHLKSQVGFIFFSPTLDLTKSLQRASTIQGSDDRFLWNSNLLTDFPAAARPFALTVIHGVVSLHNTSYNGTPIYFGLITRRSRFRAGTRYFRRGIDDSGHVANFNETEQILQADGRTFSYVQTRGSVPSYWGEVNNLKYKPQLRIGGQGSPVEAARKHFDEQTKIYGKNYLVNLVNQSGYEKPVKSSYEELVAALGDPLVEYVYFDFHHECSGMRWYRVNVLIERLEQVGLDDQGWFELRDASQHVEKTQKSVVRTNCMDCLDRTNVVQSKLGRWALQRQLIELGLAAQSSETSAVSAGVGNGSGGDAKFEKIFQNTWADNADGVSKAYSGTGALKTDFTRLGKRTKLGALNDLSNSITRYLRNNFFDGPRQDGYDLFLGNYLAFEAVESPFYDPRPAFVQSLPYVILISLVMIVAAVIFPKEDQSRTVNRVFIASWSLILALSTRRLLSKGMNFVNWPKLLPISYVVRNNRGFSIKDKETFKDQ